jgi:hypothetical protein
MGREWDFITEDSEKLQEVWQIKFNKWNEGWDSVKKTEAE